MQQTSAPVSNNQGEQLPLAATFMKGRLLAELKSIIPNVTIVIIELIQLKLLLLLWILFTLLLALRLLTLGAVKSLSSLNDSQHSVRPRLLLSPLPPYFALTVHSVRMG